MIEGPSKIERKELLPANSDYWVRPTESGITIGKRNSSEVSLTLVGNAADVIRRSFELQQAVENEPVLHLHDDDLDVMAFDGEEMVTVERATRRFDPKYLRQSDGSLVEVGFENPLVAERGTLAKACCHTTAADVARDVFEVATKRSYRQHAEIFTSNEKLAEKLPTLSFPIVVRIYRDHQGIMETQHSTVIIGEDSQTGELICFEKVGYHMPYRIVSFNKVMNAWKKILGDSLRLTAAGTGETLNDVS